MYTLRKINKKNQEELNISLGRMYTLIRKDINTDHFNKILEGFEEESSSSKIFAFIYNDGGVVHPLYEYDYHYVMTDKGSTFDMIH